MTRLLGSGGISQDKNGLLTSAVDFAALPQQKEVWGLYPNNPGTSIYINGMPYGVQIWRARNTGSDNILIKKARFLQDETGLQQFGPGVGSAITQPVPYAAAIAQGDGLAGALALWDIITNPAIAQIGALTDVNIVTPEIMPGSTVTNYYGRGLRVDMMADVILPINSSLLILADNSVMPAALSYCSIIYIGANLSLDLIITAAS